MHPGRRFVGRGKLVGAVLAWVVVSAGAVPPVGAQLGPDDSWEGGDCNRNGAVNLHDAIYTLAYLFRGEHENAPPCLALCDLDQNGRLNLTDPVLLLRFLFVVGTLPEVPTPGEELCDRQDNDCDGLVDEDCSGNGSEVELRWDAVTEDVNGAPETIAAYRVHYGTRSRRYTHRWRIGDRTRVTLGGLVSGETYYFAVTAIDVRGNESDLSEEVVATAR